MKLWWQKKPKSEVVKNSSTTLWRINLQMTSKLHNLDVTFGSGRP